MTLASFLLAVSSAFASPGALAPRMLQSSSLVCDVLNPFLPDALGCSCAAASSGVGGTATCTKQTPAVTFVEAKQVTPAVVVNGNEVTPAVTTPALALPAITFQLGTEVLPCAEAASVKLHASVTLETGYDWPTVTINDPGTGVSISGNELKIEKSAEAGKTISVPVPFAVVAGVTFQAKVNLAVSGNIAELSVTESLDVCMNFGAGDFELCGANIPTCADPDAHALVKTFCLAVKNYNVNAAFGSPPYEFMTIKKSFSDACPSASSSSASSASSSASSSSPSSPSPPTYNIEAAFTATGDVADYTTARRDAIKEVVKSNVECITTLRGCLTGVQTSDITLTVAAGSVKIIARVPVEGTYNSDQVKASLTQGIFKDTASLQGALTSAGVSGVTVEGVDPVTSVSTGGGGGGGGGGMDGGAIAGLIIGILAVVGLGVAWYVVKKPKIASSS